MEKTLTINDIFYFVNQAIEHEDNLRACRDYLSHNVFITHKDFDIFSHKENNEIVIKDGPHNSVRLKVTNMELAQFRVLWEKVKQYSENMLCNKFLKYFTSEDNTVKTIDQIDD